ncbi:MAG: Ig-like domain-containing protein, partial [Planctomycetota bacterium]
MRILGALLCVLLPTTMIAATSLTLTPAPYTVTNLGTMLSANTQERQHLFRLNGDTHLLLFYLANYGTTPMQVLDVNLTQGTTRLVDGVLGRPGVRCTSLHPNGKVYVGSGEADAKGYLLEYDPTTGATRQIAQLSDVGGYYSEIGDDGWVYVGQAVQGRVDRYHPPTDTFERLGRMDTTQTGNGQYAYTLGADTRYLYVGLGQNPWYLSVYDTVTQSKTLYWAGVGDTLGFVRQSTNGTRYYYRRDAANVVRWYHLTNGAPVLTAYTVNNPPPNLLSENGQRGNTVDGVSNAPLLGYEVNLDNAYPNSANNAATIRWRTVGASTWQSATVANFRLIPVGIQRLYPWDDSHLMGFSAFYGPVYLWNTTSGQTTILGYPTFNLYDASINQGTAYFCGYTAGHLRYDGSRSWTLTGSTTNKFDTSINPYQTHVTIGKHEFYSTFGADGLVYVGARHERDSSGGEVGWYNPATEATGSLRTPFLTHDINDLKPALGGTKLVYASTDPSLLIFDVATKTIERTIVPIPGVAMNKAVEVAPGIMFGVAETHVFTVDIRDGSVGYDLVLPGKAFAESITAYNSRLVLGPDGFIWMFRWYRDAVFYNHSALYRIDPSDGSYTVVLDNTFYAYGEMNLFFRGDDLYLYGGSTLRRIANILVPAPATQTPLITSTAGMASTLPSFVGTAVAGATIRVYNNATQIGSSTADGSGNWNWTAASPLATGIHLLTVTAQGTRLNESAPTTAVTATVSGSGGGGATPTSADSGGGGGGGGCGLGGGLGLIFVVFGAFLQRFAMLTGRHGGSRRRPQFHALLLLLLANGAIAATPVPRDSGVELSATIASNQITLSWPTHSAGFTITSTRIYRKAPTAPAWGAIFATVAGSGTTWTDTTVVVGTTYEYKADQSYSDGTTTYTAIGQCWAGIQISAVESRGTAVLIVESTIATPLAAEITRLISDLRGDGWKVLRHDVTTAQTPVAIRSLIQADRTADAAVEAVLLLGNVPVPYSGDIAPDGHA